MRAAKTTGKSLLPALLAGCVLLTLTALAWREWQHRGRFSRQAAVVAELREGMALLETARTEADSRVETLQAAVGEQRIAIQSLEDRCGNLQAQRDHLRNESDRMADQAREAALMVDALKRELEASRVALLEAQTQPRELAGQLQASEARNTALEARLDQQVAQGRHIPDSLEVTGLSTDGTVFSLSGELPEGTELPAAIHLCGTDGIYLDGWLHRREETLLIGHVKRWQSGTSKLVKGQKVFILPRITYDEADPY